MAKMDIMAADQATAAVRDAKVDGYNALVPNLASRGFIVDNHNNKFNDPLNCNDSKPTRRFLASPRNIVFEWDFMDRYLIKDFEGGEADIIN